MFLFVNLVSRTEGSPSGAPVIHCRCTTGAQSTGPPCQAQVESSCPSSTSRLFFSVEQAEPIDGKEFKGVKVRFTNGLLDDGNMAPVFLCVPGLSDKKVPPDKVPSGVVVLKAKGLAGDGCVNLDSMSYGYVARSYKGDGIEMVMFQLHDRLCSQPAADASRRCLELNPNEVCACFI